MHSRLLTFACLLTLFVAPGCAGRSTPAPSSGAAQPSAATPAPTSSQLARLASLKVMVLPTQAVGGDDRLGWRAQAGGERAVLDILDRAIESELSGRGLATQWIFPPALVRAARRNPTYVTDPYLLRALDAIRLAERRPQDPLSDPFASQLRALAGVGDVRYALVPLDVRAESAAQDAPLRSVLRVAVVDARGAQLTWLGAVAGDSLREFTPATAAVLARRLADLVVPR